MGHKIELLAPGGDIDAIKAAIAAGADAIYCGLNKFNARNRAANITFDELPGILHLAHQHACKVFLTLNIIVVESEIPALITLLNRLVNTAVDGIIVQDLGLIYLLNQHFKGLNLHASTQLTTHNAGQIQFLKTLQVSRVNLSRELNLEEIKELTQVAHQNKMQTEVFVHGSNCLSFSGLCYMSSVHGGNSGNRGSCSQPCRDQYLQTAAHKDFPLNLKDNSAFINVNELAATGVDSFKIEGRIKQFHYVYSVVESWRKQLDRHARQAGIQNTNHELYRIFNRDFTNGYLKASIGNDMFIDNPRDNSALYLAQQNGGINEVNIEWAKKTVYENRAELITQVKEKINRISSSKIGLELIVSGEVGSPLKIKAKSTDFELEVVSDQNLEGLGAEALNYDILFKRLKTINELNYTINKLSMEELQPNVFLPFKVLSALKNKLLFLLNDSKELVAPLELTKLKQAIIPVQKPTLGVLISDMKTLAEIKKTNATIYFQLPSAIKNELSALMLLFSENKHLIPWFPSIIIGKDYRAALDFLQQVQPKKLVSNNLGIAHAALQLGIDWIAGPYLNTVNSYALLNLKESFNCSGAFLSNELNKGQLRSIKRPDNFQLYFSLFHPLELMTTRQCLFHQVSGCAKNSFDNTCLEQCAKTANLQNLKNETFLLEKSKGNYCKIYGNQHYLNTAIVNDLPHLFSEFLIDLRNTKTNTRRRSNLMESIKLFENLLNDKPNSAEELHRAIRNTTYIQYKKGI